MEGSILNEADLIRSHTESASAVLLLGDRWSQNIHSEDIGLLFQVWAIKSYTKSVPLYVQAIKEDAIARVAPFLDVERDVVVSIEKFKFSNLALSTICPGASTLLGNLLRRAEISPESAKQPTIGRRQWLREYANGCAWGMYQVPVGESLVGHRFLDVSACVFLKTGCTIIGIQFPNGVLLNPGSLRLRPGDKAVLLARSMEEGQAALQVPYSKPHVDNAFDAYTSLAKAATQNGLPAGPQGVLVTDSDDYDEIDSNEVASFNEMHTGIILSMESDTMEDSVGDSMDDSTDELCSVSSPTSSADSMVALTSLGSDDDWGPLGYEALTTGTSYDFDSSNRIYRMVADSMDDDAVVCSGRGRVMLCGLDGRRLKCSTGRCDRQDLWAILESGPLRASATKNSSVKEGMEPFLKRAPNPCRSSYEEIKGLDGHIILCGAQGAMAGFAEPYGGRTASGGGGLTYQAGARGLVQARVNVRCNPCGWCALRPEHPQEGQRKRSQVGNPPRRHPAEYPQRSSAAAPQLMPGSTSDSAPEESPNDVLADADALLACYGVAEDTDKDPVHTVAELRYTNSIKFLQPGLLLLGYAESTAPESVGLPRNSWVLRKIQEQAVKAEGMAAWQANPYYASGRITVPAIIDTFSCECFFNQGLMVDILTELSGDDGRPGGALLRQVQVPEHLNGRTYGELFAFLVLNRKMVPLGLYRQKAENPVWRLPFVSTNPPPNAILRTTDKVFVLKQHHAPLAKQWVRPPRESGLE
eukprot:CAMPEP_0117686318 /NCGR_PEP_ID=MMETSP0804-20121206/22361_1 /TAXON_ID=1074897 /ORGANISM="Tetraselmis astigmatica, Strain CCMP880" /LENGTH=754 /DNA_ID=CAMNT_0005497953 /DNA_START=92 /DNA_END=2358 /DNA_ORIENTATION=+